MLPLLILPWSGLRFVERMAELARDAQWETQQTAVRSLAAALHERPDLFVADASGGRVPEGVTVVTADPPAARWRGATRHPVPVRVEGSAPAGTLKLDFAVISGGDPLRSWLLLEATDERFVPPGELDLSGAGPVVRPGDSATVLLGGEAELVAALAAGSTPPTLPIRMPIPIVPTSVGWRAELELPDDVRLIRIFAEDVDYLGSRVIEARADSGLLLLARPRQDPLAGALARNRERQWGEALRAMDRGFGRVSIYDGQGVLLARRGSVTGEAEAAAYRQGATGHGAGDAPATVLQRLARWMLSLAVRLGSLDDSPAGTSVVGIALSGVPAQRAERLHLATGMPAWQLAAAHPVWNADRVVGALLLEDSTVQRLALAQDALERLVLFVAAAIAATALALLAIASLAVARILRLRRAAEAAIDSRGRVVGRVPRDGLHDEVDALAESYGRVLERLREHQEYLARLRSRLLHELRTPIMVVRSSLDNLAVEPDPERGAAYARRAQAGAARLERIVASMGEAGSLEAMLKDADLERIDLAQLLTACVDGYRIAYPDAIFETDLPGGPALASVVPEAIAQALDKLVSNAIDFATPRTPIRLGLSGTAQGQRPLWRLAVTNTGPALPAAMAGSLFESMVSVREGEGGASDGSGRGHLGFGLYLVRLIAEFHGGSARARDVAGGVEVGFTVAAGPAGP